MSTHLPVSFGSAAGRRQVRLGLATVAVLLAGGLLTGFSGVVPAPRALLGTEALLWFGVVPLLGLALDTDAAAAVESMAADVRGLTEGDFDVEFPSERSDAVGELADALATLTGSLREQREQTAENESYRRELYQLTSDPSLTDDEKLDRLLALGCERFGLEAAALTEIDTETGRYEVTRASGSDFVQAGTVADLSETFCRWTLESDGIFSLFDVDTEGFGDDPADEKWEISSYIGGKIEIDGELHGTLCFVDPSARDVPFSHAEKAFMDLMTRWVTYVLETQRHAAELERKNRALEAAPIGITISGPVAEDTPIKYANDAFTELTGYEEDEILGRNCRFLQGEQTDEEPVARLREAIEAGETASVELRNYRADGTEFWNQVTIAPIDEGAGEDTRFVGFQEDVTDRKQRETELLGSKRQFEAVFDDPQMLVGLLDPDGTVRRSNERSMEFVDVDHEDVVGEPFWETPWWTDEIRDDVESWIARAADGEYVEYEADLEDSEGEPYSVEGTIRPVTDDDGEVVSLVVSARDVTERKAYQRDLQETKRRLELATEGTNTGIWDWNLETDEVTWSDTFEEVVGLEPGEFDGTYEAFERRVHPEDEPDVEAAIEATLEEGEQFEVEHRLRHETGDWIWIKARGRLVTDADGHRRLIGINYDITERKQRERDLEETNEQLRAIIEASPDAIVALDTDGTVERWNPAAERIFGWAAEEVIGGPNPIIPEDKEAEYERFRERVLDGEAFTGEEIVRERKDGERIDLSLSVAPIRDEDGSVEGIMAAMEDISERKAAEQELKRTKDLLARAEEIADLGGWAADIEDGAVANRRWTEKMYEIFEMPPDEGPSRERLLEQLHPEDREQTAATIEAAVENGERFEHEARVQLEDGSIRWVNSIGEPVIEDGGTVGMRGAVQDITERKERERELREKERRLSTLMGNVPGMVYRCRNEPDWPMTFVSDGVEELTGYQPETVTSEDFSWSDAVIADKHEELWETVQASLDAREPFRVTYPIETADGERRWFEEQGRGVFDGDELEALEGVIIDVTERVESEQELRDTRDRLTENTRILRRLYEISADREASLDEKIDAILEIGCEWLDTKGAFLSRIDEECDEFEFTHTVGLDNIYPGLVAPYSETYCRKLVDLEGVFDVTDASAEGWDDDPAYERWHLETYFGAKIRVDGQLTGTLSFVDTEPHEEPLREDQRAFIELVTQWVTHELERRRHQRELEDYQQFTDDLLDAIDDVFYVLGGDGTLRRWNESLSTVTGYDDEEIETMHATEFFPEDEVQPISDAIQRVFEQGHALVEADFLTEDGTRIPYEFAAVKAEAPDGKPILAGIARDITERKAREAKLERTTALLEQAQRVAAVGGWEIELTDGEPTDMTWTDQFYEIFEIPRDEEPSIERVLELCHPDYRAAVEAAMGNAIERGERFDMEMPIRTVGGEAKWVHSIGEPVVEDGAVVRLRGSLQDVTVQKHHELALESLHDATRSLLTTDSDDEVSELVVDAAAEVLDVPGVSIYTLDSETNRLEPSAFSPGFVDLCDGVPEITVGDTESIVWNTFVTGTQTAVTDGEETGDSGMFAGDVESGLVVPIGDHGVFVALSDAPTIDATTRQLVETLVATTEAAFDRLANEASLRERDQELEARNERLRRQVQITEIIRSIDRSLIGATTREEIERSVCERLAEDESIALAWIGTRDSSGQLTPRAWAGDDDSYLDAITAGAADETEPAVAALDAESPTVVGNVVERLQDAEWSRHALERNFNSVLAVPLTFDEYSYGVLAVYAPEPGAFGDLEESVFSELGESIANSITAAKTRQALHAETHLELRLRFEGADDLLSRVARQIDSPVEYEGLSTHADSETRLFFRTPDADPESVLAVLEDLVSVTDARLITDDAEAPLFEATTTGPCIAAKLVRHGGRPRTITATGDEVEVTVDMPTETDVREFVEMLRDSHPSVELDAQRHVERATHTKAELVSGLLEDLTDRQREVLQTAYFAGFFEQPRETTGEELAEMLGVSQPTVNRHLRLAQQRLMSQLFGGNQELGARTAD